LGSFQVDEWSTPRRVLVPAVIALGIGSPVIGSVLSLKRLPPRLVEHQSDHVSFADPKAHEPPKSPPQICPVMH
jgi:hypothetical protein